MMMVINVNWDQHQTHSFIACKFKIFFIIIIWIGEDEQIRMSLKKKKNKEWVSLPSCPFLRSWYPKTHTMIMEQKIL